MPSPLHHDAIDFAEKLDSETSSTAGIAADIWSRGCGTMNKAAELVAQHPFETACAVAAGTALLIATRGRAARIGAMPEAAKEGLLLAGKPALVDATAFTLAQHGRTVGTAAELLKGGIPITKQTHQLALTDACRVLPLSQRATFLGGHLGPEAASQLIVEKTRALLQTGTPVTGLIDRELARMPAATRALLEPGVTARVESQVAASSISGKEIVQSSDSVKHLLGEATSSATQKLLQSGLPINAQTRAAAILEAMADLPPNARRNAVLQAVDGLIP